MVERIVGSPAFLRSPRLCSLLTHLCELALKGRSDEINEQSIGEALFERPPNYDPSIDGIVRSHASRLRQRLEQYFNEEGAREPIRLSIPKGGYTPLFEVQSVTAPEQSRVVSASSSSADDRSALMCSAPVSEWYRPLFWSTGSALLVACMFIVFLLFRAHSAPAVALSVPKHPLWSAFFGPDQSPLVVASDTGLTSLQTLTSTNVNLAEYLSGDYRTHVAPPAGTTVEIAKVLASRRYTSIVDLDIVTKLYQLPGAAPNRIQLRYARDLRPNDLKNRPVILLGSKEGTPWVQLFEDKMNFIFVHDHQNQRFLVLNRLPQNNELSRYEADLTGPVHRIYGLIALRPNIEGSGSVLLLEGTSMAGTESAADFIFDDSRLSPFLEKIRQKNGSLPYFELLLQSNNMNGSASGSSILAYRTTGQ
ncbi:hypothetical protein [Tunturiibacter gelidiferens]|uniref:hypothetical protein n=1 Tax=Tunturiibacter gelidiferens TaxID=3069689 RepID=UPI003D9B1500